MDRAGGAVDETDRRDAPSLGVLLECGESALAASLPSDRQFAERLGALRTRLQEGRLQIAVLGQFKRGKSTFLNALLGDAYLPSAVIPVTALPVFIGWGAVPVLRVSYQGGTPPDEFRPDGAAAVQRLLHGFVAEEGNPENRKGVVRVELSVPAPILRQNITLIDTPGVGSTHRHNTDAALDVLPECDAGLFILSLDPPITEREIEYLRLIRPRVARLFFVVNKIDLVDGAELRQAMAFTRDALRREGLIADDTTVFAASARLGLVAQRSRSQSGFAVSGMKRVEDELLGFLAREKMQSLETAAAIKGAAILAEAEAALHLRLRALELPIETLDRKRQVFERLIEPIESRRLTTRDLLKGERARLVDRLETEAAALRADALEHLMTMVHDIGARTDATRFRDHLGEAVAKEIPVFFDDARHRMTQRFALACQEALDAHRARIGELSDAVRKTAASTFDIAFVDAAEDETFRAAQEPYWLEQKWSAGLIPDLGPVVDRLLPVGIQARRLEARLRTQLSDLVVRNVENLRWSILRGLDETFIRAAGSLETRLDGAIAATRQAIADARALREGQAQTLDQEIARLHAAAAAIASLRQSLAAGPGPLP